MKKNEKILILALIAILVVVIIKVNTGNDKELPENEVKEEQVKEEYVQVLEDGTKLNTSEQLNKTKKVGNLEFTNIQLTNRNGQSVLLAEVRNNGSTATKVMLVDVIILDKNGRELGKVGGIISPLNAGETTQFNSSMTIDYSNAYDFKIVQK